MSENGWRLIEEAKNDSTPLLCLNIATGEVRVGVRKRFSQEHYEKTGRHWYEYFRDDELVPGRSWSMEVTHFMPLPQPPQE